MEFTDLDDENWSRTHETMTSRLFASENDATVVKIHIASDPTFAPIEVPLKLLRRFVNKFGIGFRPRGDCFAVDEYVFPSDALREVVRVFCNWICNGSIDLQKVRRHTRVLVLFDLFHFCVLIEAPLARKHIVDYYISQLASGPKNFLPSPSPAQIKHLYERRLNQQVFLPKLLDAQRELQRIQQSLGYVAHDADTGEEKVIGEEDIAVAQDKVREARDGLNGLYSILVRHFLRGYAGTSRNTSESLFSRLPQAFQRDCFAHLLGQVQLNTSDSHLTQVPEEQPIYDRDVRRRLENGSLVFDDDGEAGMDADVSSIQLPPPTHPVPSTLSQPQSVTANAALPDPEIRERATLTGDSVPSNEVPFVAAPPQRDTGSNPSALSTDHLTVSNELPVNISSTHASQSRTLHNDHLVGRFTDTSELEGPRQATASLAAMIAEHPNGSDTSQTLTHAAAHPMSMSEQTSVTPPHVIDENSYVLESEADASTEEYGSKRRRIER